LGDSGKTVAPESTARPSNCLTVSEGWAPIFDPVLHAALVDHDLLGLVFIDRIVVAQLLENLAIAGRAVIDRVDAPEGVIFSDRTA